MIRRCLAVVLAAALGALAAPLQPRVHAASAASHPGFAVRMVKLGGLPSDPATLEHVRFCRKAGFNALWVYSYEAGAWTKERAPNGPVLNPDFLRLVRWCRRNRMELWVSINPVADTDESFIFSDPAGEGRLLSFIKLLREQAGVRRIVLSFDDQPTKLKDLSDIFRYGLSAAPAHLDLMRRIAVSLPKDVAPWLCPSTYADRLLDEDFGGYAKPFLADLQTLPPNVGIVWTGPGVLSPTITVSDLTATRKRLGGRELLLYDNFTVDEFDADDAMALILGALRGRDAGIRDLVRAYLVNPEHPLAGSRLSLLTVADFLNDPEGYDPTAAARRAVVALAGPDREAQTALETQQLEWGGFIDGRNYWPRGLMNPEVAAGRLLDPAFVESFTWTVTRYPGRMASIERGADTAFVDQLLRIMRRRLTVAQAMPLTIEYLARIRAGRLDAAESLARIDDLRRSWKDDLDAARILDLFLAAADIPWAGRPK